MSITTAIIIYVAGIAAAALLRSGLLHRRVSDPIASGLAWYVLMLTQHPLMLTTGSTMSFLAWAIWGVFITVVIVVIWADSK
jgi:hypothetical protein